MNHFKKYLLKESIDIDAIAEKNGFSEENKAIQWLKRNEYLFFPENKVDVENFLKMLKIFGLYGINDEKVFRKVMIYASRRIGIPNSYDVIEKSVKLSKNLYK